MLPVIRRTLRLQGHLTRGHTIPLATPQCPAQTRTFLQSTRQTKRPSLPTHPHRTRPQTRNATFSSHNPYSPRTLLRNHPIAFPLAIGSVLLTAAGFAYGVALYMRMYSQMGSYPEKVGLKLRRGIYFTDISPDAAQAMKAYVQALQLAEEMGMHPLCNEVIGIKTELVRFLEKTGNVANAIEVCEALKSDCLRWIEREAEVLKANTDPNGKAEREAAARGERTRLLGWACKIATRTADLYALTRDHAKMESNLVWAVETTIRERQRRDREGVRPGEGDWLDLDDQGSQLESLAHFYEERENHYFAAQLFLQALMLKPVKDCHAVVLMNNLAISLAQQVPPTEAGSPPPSRAQMAEAGRVWARQALALGQSLKPPERTEECDMGCAVATHNLAEFAEMEGNVAEARRRYEEAAGLAGAIGFEEGIENANEGLRRLDGGGGGGPGGKRKKGSWWKTISNT